MNLEVSPKEREALVNYSIEAVKSLMDLLKASTERVKLGTESAREAIAEEKKKKEQGRNSHN